MSISVGFHWIRENGTQVSVETLALGTAGVGWARFKTAATAAAPAAAKYLSLRVYVSSAALPVSGHLNIFKPQVIDTAWRPVGIPTLNNNNPLSSALAPDINQFIHKDYYEQPREVKINIYPNRTNLALNSNFVLNNVPAGAWATYNAPTYGQLRQAYTDYADIIDGVIGDSESSYADMASGLAPLVAGAPTPVFEISGGGRMYMNKTSAPYTYSVTHTFFEVTELGGMSAAVGAYSSVENTTMTMMFEWYTDNTAASIIKDQPVDGVPIRHISPEYTLKQLLEARYELVDAQPPSNALYARLILTFTNDVAHEDSLTWALIEDAPFPGEYFTGSYNEGSDGDFFYAKGQWLHRGVTPVAVGLLPELPSVLRHGYRRPEQDRPRPDPLPAQLQDHHRSYDANRVVQPPKLILSAVHDRCRSCLVRGADRGCLDHVALAAAPRRQGLRLPDVRGDGGGGDLPHRCRWQLRAVRSFVSCTTLRPPHMGHRRLAQAAVAATATR